MTSNAEDAHFERVSFGFNIYLNQIKTIQFLCKTKETRSLAFFIDSNCGVF